MPNSTKNDEVITAALKEEQQRLSQLEKTPPREGYQLCISPASTNLFRDVARSERQTPKNKP